MLRSSSPSRARQRAPRLVAAAVATLTTVATTAALLSATTVDASAVTWPAPATISLAGNTATPQVVVSADGTAIAVWDRFNGSNYVIQGATRPAGGTWQNPVDLSQTGQNALAPQVAVAPDGTATVVWNRSNGFVQVVQAATRPAGGSWQTPVDVSATNPVDGANAFDAQVAIASDGSATVVWYTSNGTDELIQAATRPGGGSWTTPVNLSVAAPDATQAQVAVAPDGTATAVWARTNGTNTIIQSATRPAGGAWTSVPDNLSASGRDASKPRVAVGPDGTVTAVWTGSDGLNTIIQSASRAPGGSWSAAVDLSPAGSNADVPRLAVGPDGTTTAVWDRADHFQVVQAATRAPSGAWQSPVALSGTGGNAFDPTVAFGPDGSTLVTWYGADATTLQVGGALRPTGGAWSGPFSVFSSGFNIVDRAQLAIGPDGTAAVVWRYTSNTVQAVVLDKAFPKPRPVPPATVPATGAVKGPRIVARPHTAKFTFSGTAASSFQCRLDKAKKWVACRSPYKLRTKKLKAGKHVLYVRAVLNGVPDPTPSVKRFKIR